ncbi:uncharacterized protein LOC120441767 [Oreochromis aureus]|uniref:uncharacterized protein LOC120441767 n=1 Tax=Oreochromis aureus TaxID=47969 RepID=UPI0019532215|nr:uncharacterized protein LOC120441767 [Oreochromis aureus]
MNVTSDPHVASAIREYFDSGHTYEVILDMLKTNHEISISLRTLKTHLKEAGLYRRGNYSPLPEVRRAILNELRGPGQLFGYRTMWQVLKQKHKLHVKRSVVMVLLRQLNPQGIVSRTRRRFTRRTYHSMGPNYIWHVDGYDKLKPFGFALSGCIDGFSRRMMWLVCGASNNNPAVIAHNFINCVKSLGVIPMRLRTDLGTENGTMAAIQCTLRHAHADHYAGSLSHSYGSSTGNQRIESWWSFLRRGRSQFWMDLFGDLRDSGNFNGSHEHQCLLRFCFINVLQKDLDECKDLWNKHRIRPSRLASCPGGIPNELYLLPHRYGSRDCGFAVEERELDVFPEGRQAIELCGDSNIEEYLHHTVQQNRLEQPQDWESATELYLALKNVAGF